MLLKLQMDIYITSLAKSIVALYFYVSRNNVDVALHKYYLKEFETTSNGPIFLELSIRPYIARNLHFL